MYVQLSVADFTVTGVGFYCSTVAYSNFFIDATYVWGEMLFAKTVVNVW